MKSAVFLFLFLPLIAAAQAAAPPKAYDDPASTDEDFPFQGEYAGEVNGVKMGVQIIALGGGGFEAVGYTGGLPGDGWDGNREEITHTKGKRGEGGTSAFFERGEMKAEVDGVKIFVTKPGEAVVMELTRVDRKSPSLGAAAPAGAMVLFDGKAANHFPKSKVTADGLLQEGALSEDKFTDFSLHLEFRLPYMPDARGQARGNSGVYLQGRYEVQVLDSFGLEGKDNECGGLYQIAAPKLNLCFSPLTWQTYDIDFSAAKFDAESRKTANAKVTVKLNGVVIQENQEIPGPTGSSPVKDETSAPGPIYLQDHGNPVRYRNVWVAAK